MNPRPEPVEWDDIAAAIQENPTRNMTLRAAETASGSLAIMPEPPAEDVPWLAGWKEDTTFTIADAVSLSLWVRDPLYRTAAASLQRAMEMEEATVLLDGLEENWKRLGGRTRSWIRKHLEEDLRPRSGGADPSSSFFVDVRTSKRAALLTDYVCVVRGLRVALWWPTSTSETAATTTSIGAGQQIIQLNATSNHVLVAESGFLTTAPAWNRLATGRWIPAASAPSIGSTTVSQITEQLVALGETPTGNRQALWNHLQWILLVRSIQNGDAEEKDISENPIYDTL